MIRFDQVSKRYPGGIAALGELTFTVESGEMVILSGHSGAGKSTLLKLIPAARRLQVKVVSLTGAPESTLATNSDVVVPVRVEREAGGECGAGGHHAARGWE